MMSSSCDLSPSADSSSEKRLKYLFVHPTDFFQIIGKAEVFYVYKHLQSKHHVILHPFLPTHRILKKLPVLVAFNAWSLAMLPKFYRNSPFDLTYSYSSAIVSPAIFKRLQGTPWIYDIRTHPVTQSPRSLGGHPLRRLSTSIYDGFKCIANRFAFRQCDLIVTVSTALKEQLVAQLGAPPEKVFVLPLGVDRKLFKPTDGQSPSPPGTLRMVYASSVALYRGHQACIDAARILKNRGIPFTMEFMGSGEKLDIDLLKKLTKDHGLEKDVLWRGFIPHRELPEHLSRAHIGLSPLPDIEAYRVSSPTKVFEYMAMGLAIIASDILAHRHILEDGKTGLFFRPEDPEDLADRVQELYSDPDRRTKLAKAAVEASKAYDWKVLLEGLDKQIQLISRL